MADSTHDWSLDESERVYRCFVDLSPLPMALHDGRTILLANPAAAVSFGYDSPEDLIGVPVISLVHPDFMPVVARRTAAMLRGEQVPPLVEKLIRKDGSTLECETFASPVTCQGRPAVQVFVRDLTEVRAAESELRRGEESYRQLFEMSPDPTVVHDGETPLKVNRAFMEFMAIGEDTPATASMWTVLADDQREQIAERLKNMRESGLPTPPLAIRLRALNGELREAELMSAPTWWEGQQAIVTVFRDLTERNRSEKALGAMQERFSAVVEQAPIAIHFYELDSDDRLIFTGGNKASGDILGVVPGSRAGMPIETAWPGLADTEVPARHREVALNGGLDVRLVEYEHGDTKGVFESHVFPIGERACVTMFLDVTGRIRDEEELDRYRSHLEQLVAERTRELDQAHRDVEAITSVVASAVELRDPYTAGHQKRVAQLAHAVAERLQLPDETCEHVRIAALLHDIGKLSIPAEILSKPGALLPVEYELVKGHVQAAEEILKQVEVDWPLPEMVLQHHERMDGSGYPQGLAGDDIILEARIMAVADVVEAMSSHRPYRASLGLASAIAEIKANRGRLYDAEVVDACVAVFDSGFELEPQSL